MLTLILPGYSKKNKDWAYEVKNNLKSSCRVVVHEWRHWVTESEVLGLNIKVEVENILKEIKNEEINIIAKSIGTLICMKLIDTQTVRVNKIILCGIPINDIGDEDFDDYRILVNVADDKIICFQNSKDPHGNYRQVFSFLDKINPNIKIINKDADTHDYPYYEDFAVYLK